MPQPGEDYYNDGGDDSSAAAPADQNKGESGDGGKTSILPRSFFAGKDLKVGDKIEVEVSGIHENDVEVTASDEGSDEEESQETPEQESAEQPEAPDGGEPPASDGSMSSMMS